MKKRTDKPFSEDDLNKVMDDLKDYPESPRTFVITPKGILYLAIQKAIDNGWKTSVPYVLDTIDKTSGKLYGYDIVSGVIFNHDFAKALWGEQEAEKDTYGGEVEFYDYGGTQWQYHLMCMVIADDPIAYLGENI